MRLFFLTLFILVSLPGLLPAASGDVQLLKQARSQIRLIAGELQQNVVSSVRENGVENSLSACRVQVSEVVGRLSRDGGWEIRRTALRVRNPKNTPDTWEREVLGLFEQRQVEGVDLENFEFAKVVNIDGKRVFRYMKPIMMQQDCLVCHGASLSPAEAKKIAEQYPDDRATRFSPGELRGAFSLLRVLPGDPP